MVIAQGFVLKSTNILNRYAAFIVFILSILLFSIQLSRHTIVYRDDEIFYFQSAKEMLTTGEYFSPTYFGENRFQKPILFYWLIIGAYKIFGVNWFAARMVSVIFAALTLSLTWTIGSRFFGEKVGALSVLILATCPLFLRHAKNAVPDMALNFFIVAALYCVLRFYEDPQDKKFGWLFFLCCALGFMIKGFAALVIPFLTLLVSTALLGKWQALKNFNFPAGISLLIAIILPWFLYMNNQHGAEYTQYVLKNETLNRLLDPAPDSLPVKLVRTLITNASFYVQTLLTYLAPWSIFYCLAFPWMMINLKNFSGKKEPLMILLVWVAVVFLFFSSIFTKINHLILVLTTPFAIGLAVFFVHLNRELLLAKMIRGLLIGFMTLILLIFVFVKVFLVNENALGILFYGLFLGGFFSLMKKSQNKLAGPVLLGVTLIFLIAQIPWLEKANLTPQAALKRMAQTFNQRAEPDSLIGVGSDDLHEKELQVFIDRKVEKAASSYEPETRWRLEFLFGAQESVYCIMTQKDFDLYMKESIKKKVQTIQEELICRRKMHLDRGFLQAVLTLDRPKVQEYLLEKVILVYKGRKQDA